MVGIGPVGLYSARGAYNSCVYRCWTTLEPFCDNFHSNRLLRREPKPKQWLDASSTHGIDVLRDMSL